MEQGKIRTMIVEDDPMVMEVNRQFVEATEGFEIVGLASTGSEAIEKIPEFHPDLIILDIYLPDLDGLQTLEEIRRRNVPVDVILVTAARDSETIKKVFRYGAIDYIVKPFKFDRFKNALQSYRTLRNTLEKDSLDQDEIDKLAALRNSSSNSEKIEGNREDQLPKGLNDITYKQIIHYLLKQTSSQSAEEVAEGVGLSRVTARRYLEYLEKIGRVKLEVQYGSVGRPVNRYVAR